MVNTMHTMVQDEAMPLGLRGKYEQKVSSSLYRQRSSKDRMKSYVVQDEVRPSFTVARKSSLTSKRESKMSSLSEIEDELGGATEENIEALVEVPPSTQLVPRARSTKSYVPQAPRNQTKTVPIFVDVDSFIEPSFQVNKHLLEDIAIALEKRELTPRFVATTCERLKTEADFIRLLGKGVNDRFYRNVGIWKTKDADLGGGDSATHVIDIQEYLRGHSFEYYLVLDGYDLIQDENFSELHCILLDASASTEKINTLLDKQTKANEKKAAAAQRYTPDEWKLLEDSPLCIQVLKSDKCPLWQMQAANAFLKKAKRERQMKKQKEFSAASGQQNKPANKCQCSVS